ncbi:MAG: YdbH domain-containing protein [Bdellovibrionota bacterium]
MERFSAYEYRIPSCDLQLSVGNDLQNPEGQSSHEGAALRVSLKNGAISFHSLRSLFNLGPALSIEHLDVTFTPTEVAAIKTATVGADSNRSIQTTLPSVLPITELVVHEANVVFGDGKRAILSFTATRTVRGTFELDAKISSLDYSPFLAGVSASLHGELRQLPDRSELRWKLAPVALDASHPIAPLPTVSINAGSLAASGNIHWGNGRDIEAEIRASGRELAGTLMKRPFVGGDIRTTLLRRRVWETEAPARCSVRHLDFGVPLTDVSFRGVAHDDFRRVEISEIRAAVFGGTIGADNVRFRDGVTDGFVLTGEGIELEQLLELAGHRVQGRGSLHGTLPIQLRDGMVKAEDGKVEGVNGELKFTPSQELKQRAAANPNLKLALDALEQFEYERLDATLNYATDGTLTSSVSLLGKNPNLFHGRQIQFNINVEENLPALLKSSRLATEANPELWQDRN